MGMGPRIFITGGGGQLADALTLRFQSRSNVGGIWAPTELELDITDAGAVRNALESARPNWVINCAAYTAVDAAEGEPGRAFLVNDAAVRILADAAFDCGARLLHLSTDYVFDGAKADPYVEQDSPHPLNVYGASKLAGERRLLEHPVRSAILRTAWLYGEKGANFLLWAVKKGKQALETGEPVPVVNDQVGSPTDVHTLSAQIEAVLEDELEGLFHASAEGAASWFEFAEEIFSQLNISPPMKGVRWEEIARQARRPQRVILENRRLKDLGKNRMIHWREGLRGVIAGMAC